MSSSSQSSNRCYGSRYGVSRRDRKGFLELLYTTLGSMSIQRPVAHARHILSFPRTAQVSQTRLLHRKHAVSCSTIPSSNSMTSSRRKFPSQSSHLNSGLVVELGPESVAIGIFGRTFIFQNECNVLLCGSSVLITTRSAPDWDRIGSASGCWRCASYRREMVLAAQRQTSASVLMWITAPSQQDAP